MQSTRRSALLLTAGLIGLSLLSCGREVTGPENGVFSGRARVGVLAIDPQLPTLPTGDLASDVAPFERVRLVLQRTDGSVAKDTMIDFPSTADSVALALTLPLPLTASDSGLTFGLILRYINAAGDTVFAGGPSPVLVRPLGSPGATEPVVIPVTWVPSGGVAPASATIVPDTGTVVAGTTTQFSGIARDAQGNVLVGTPFGFISPDATRATVTVAGGVATWLPVRGPARIIATTLNGIADTANVMITLPASRLLLVSGGAQSAVINTALAQPLVLRVTASDSVPVSGRQVTFAVTAGGGTLSVAVDTSDAEGLVSVNWTLGALVGAQSVTASVTGVAGATQVVPATALAQVPTQLVLTSGPVGPQVAGVPLPNVTVEARDASGVRVAAFTGQVRALVIGAEPDSAFATAVAGVATFTGAVLETSGTYHVRFSSGALSEAVSDTFVVSAGPAAILTAVSGDAQGGTVATALAAPFVVRVADAFGNAVAGRTVDWEITAGGGTLSAASSVSDADGLASTTLTLPTTSGNVAITAAAAGLVGSPVTFGATATAGAATQLVYRAGPLSLVAGVPGGTFIFEALDAQGNLASGFGGTVTLTLANGPVGATSSPGSVTAVDGIIQFLLSVDLADPDYRLVASAAGLTSDTTSAFSVVAGAPSALVVTAGDAQSGTVSAPLADSVTFRLTDAFGNPIAAAPITVTVVQGGGATSPATGSTNANGEFRTAWTLGAALGAQLVRATVTSAPAVQAVASANAVAGTPAQLAITSGAIGTQVAGVALPTLVVEARDASGNLATGFTGTVWVRVNSGPVLGADSVGVSAVGGVATFIGLVYERAGTYTLRFSADGLTDALSPSFDVIAGAAAAIAPDSVAPGNGQTGTVGLPLPQPLRALVADGFGNGIGGVLVTFTATRGVDTLGTAGVVSDAAGLVSYTPTLPTTSGPVAYLVTADGLIGSGFSLSVTAASGAATQLAVTLQPDTVAAATPMGVFVVQARDLFGNAGTGFAGTVTAEILSGPADAILGGTLSTVAVGGEATFNTLTLDITGDYTLRFTANTLSSVNAVVTVVAGAPGAVAKVGGDSQGAPINTLLPDSLAVRVTDAGGNPVAGVATNWAVTSGGGALSASVATTGTDGIARVAWTLGPVAGTQQVDMEVTGAGTATFTATGSTVSLTWAGTVSDAWTDPANWVEGRAPLASDSITIPDATFPFAPRITASTFVRSLVNLSPSPLTVDGAVALQVTERLLTRLDTVGVSCPTGALDIGAPGASTAIRGRVDCNLRVIGDNVALDGETRVGSGRGASTQVSGQLVVNGQRLTVEGGFFTFNTSRLVMTNPADTVTLDDASFQGGPTTGSLTAGLLRVRGGLDVPNAPDAFAASGNHRTQFVAGIGDTATLASGSGEVRFGAVEFARPVRLSGDFGSAGDAFVNYGGAVVGPSGRLSIGGSLVGTSGTLVAPRAIELAGVLADTGTFRPDTTIFSGAGQVMPFRVGAAAIPEYQAVRLTGDVTIAPSGAVDSIGGGLVVEGSAQLSDATTAATLVVTGDLEVTGAGAALSSHGQPHLIRVNGNARFDGTEGVLAAGTLEVFGDFRSAATHTARSFRPAWGYRVRLTGNGVVEFANPEESYFGKFEVLLGTTREFRSDVLVIGTVELPASVEFAGSATFTSDVLGAGGTRILTFADAVSQGADHTFRNIALRMTGPIWNVLCSCAAMTFSDFDPEVVQFELSRDGGSDEFRDLTFTTTPTGAGRYLRVVDTDPGNGDDFTIQVLGAPTPQFHGGLAEAVAPATLTGWFDQLSFTWTGAVSTDWATAGNWSGTQVPTATDSVFVPGGLSTYPVVSAPTTVRALAMGAGATLTHDAILSVAGSVELASGANTGGSARLELVGPGAQTVRGTFGTVRVNGGTYSLVGASQMGNLDVYDGDLAVGDFDLTLTGGLLTGLGGTFTMTGTGIVDVADYVNFFGNSTRGRLTNGILRVRGDFEQLSSGPGSMEDSSFVATGNHVVELAGTGVQVVRFDSPDTLLTQTCATSCFATLRSAKPSGAVVFETGVKALRDLDLAVPDSISAPSRYLVAGGTLRLDSPRQHLGLIAWRDSLAYDASVLVAIDSVVAWGSDTLLVTIPTIPTHVAGSYRVRGQIDGSLSVTGALDVDGTARIVGNLQTGVGGVLRMTDATDSLVVDSLATFAGASTEGLLTAGVLRVGGSFFASGGGAFAASSGHRLQLFPNCGLCDGYAVALGDTLSRFGSLVVEAGTWDLDSLAADVHIVDNLTVDAGATVRGGLSRLLRLGNNLNVVAGGTLDVGRLQLAGTLDMFGTFTVDTLIRTGGDLFATDGNGGTFPYQSVRVAGPVNAVPDAAHVIQVGGQLMVEGAGFFTVGVGAETDSVRIQVAGPLRTANLGVLAMQSPLARITTGSDAIFNGGVTEGVLTAGVLEIGGNFSQDSTGLAFVATETHVTRFVSEGTQSIAFFSPGGNASRFQHLELAQAPGSAISLLSNAFASGQFRERMATPARVRASAGTPRQLITNGASVSGIRLDGVRWTINDGAPIDSLFDITVDSVPELSLQFVIQRRDPAITINGLTFLVPSVGPGASCYLCITDFNEGPLVVTVVNPFPAAHNGQVLLVGTAQIAGWNESVSATFTGGVGSDWGTAANWSTGAVPDLTTDVLIPAGQIAQLNGVRAVRNLTVAAGATVTIPQDDTLRTRGDVDIQGLVNTAVTDDPTAVLELLPDVIEALGRADTVSLAATGTIAARTLVSSGVVRLSDSVRVVATGTGGSILDVGLRVTGGTLDLNGQTLAVESVFETSGTGTLVMTNPADSLDVSETIRFAGGSTEGRLTAGVITARAEFLQDLGVSPTAFAATGSHLVRFVGDFGAVVEMASGGPSGSRFARVALDKGVGRRVEFRNTPIEIAEIASLNGSVLVAATTVNVSGAVQAPGPNGGFDLASDGFIVLAGVNPATCDGLSFTVNVTPANFTPSSCVSAPAIVWTGGAGTTEWNTTTNWQGGVLPTATDSVVVPAGASIAPVVPAGTELRALIAEQLVDGLGDLTITGTLSLPTDLGMGCGSGGQILFAGDGEQSMKGRVFCSVRVLSGTLTARDSMLIEDSDLQVEGDATFDVGTAVVRVLIGEGGGFFATLAQGALRMTDAAGQMRVDQGATFAGRSTDGLLTAGTLSIGGNFTQSAIASTSSFAPSESHETVFATEGTQQVSMETPGQVNTASHFQHLRIAQASGSQLQLNGDVYVNGQLREDVSWQVEVGAIDLATLYTGGADVSGIVFENVRWEILDGDAITTLDAVAFGSTADNVPQFGITRTSGSYAATNFSFATTPVTGSYVRLEDPDGLTSGTLTLTMTGTIPNAHGGLVEIIAPAELLGWNENPPALVNSWTGGGGANTNWNNTANWSLGRLPNATDSVVVDLPGSYSVSINVNSQLAWLTVGSAGTPTFVHAGSTLTVDSIAFIAPGTTWNMSGSAVLTGPGQFQMFGTMTWSGGTMSGTGSTLIGALGSLAVTGAPTLNTRDLIVGGTMTLGGTAFNAVGLPTLATAPGGTIEFTSTTSYFSGNGIVDVVNAGTLRKAATAGLVRVDWPIANTGVFEVADDTLDLRNALTHIGGSLAILPGAALLHGGETQATAPVTIGTGGRMQLQSGGISPNAGNHHFLAGSEISGSGWLRINSADTTRIEGSLDIDSLTVQNGNTWFDGPDTMVVTHGAYLGGGFFRGSGVIGVRGSFELIPGNVVGTGTFSVRNAGTLTFRGMTGWQVDIDDGGTAIWGDYDLSFGQDTLNSVPYSGVRIRNGGTWLIQHDVTSPRELFARGATTGQVSTIAIDAGGVMRKTSGTGISNIRSRVEVAGLIDVQSGSINVQGSCAVLGGSLTTSGGGTLTGNVSPTGGCTFPSNLVFTGGTLDGAEAGDVLDPITVEVRNASNGVLTSYNGPVTLSLAQNPTSTILLGTTTVQAVSGVATFSEVAVGLPGSGYELTASAGSIPGSASGSFAVATPTVPPDSSSLAANGNGAYCAIDVSGSAHCWGNNTNGQLGVGDLTTRLSPTLVSGGLSFQSITAGNGHTCGIATTGDAYCWGRNTFGALGDNSTTNSNVPVLVQGGLTWRALDAGTITTCGLTTTGEAYCWGHNGGGRIGDGTETNRLTPTPVNIPLRFTRIRVGGFSACALTAAGYAYCWGTNDGRIGNGTTANALLPTLGGGAARYARLSVADLTGGTLGPLVCGVTVAGENRCWGNRTNGGFADGSTTGSSLTPAPALSGLVPVGLDVREGGRGCATDAGGNGYCWGSNAGTLGNGTFFAAATTPAAVSGGLTFNTIVPGANSTCGITSTGAAQCWGVNEARELGDGGAEFALTPTALPFLSDGQRLDLDLFSSLACARSAGGGASCWGINLEGGTGTGSTADFIALPQAVSGGHTFTDLGLGRAACGVDSSGTLRCWGDGANFQLGFTSVSSNVPVTVPTALQFSAVSRGNGHACALAVDGSAHCWGLNGAGQLGRGTTSTSEPLGAVSGGLTFDELGLGNQHACGRAGTAVYCWGSNTAFAIGDGNTATTPRTAPTPVAGSNLAQTIFVGGQHSCMLRTDGETRCWGNGSAGQLGNGGNASQATPVVPSGGLTFTTLALGGNHTCGITTGGETYCWGINLNGQLGDGTFTNRNVPTLVSGAPAFVSLRAGLDLTCGTTAANETYCWGRRYGRFGALPALTPQPVVGGITFRTPTP